MIHIEKTTRDRYCATCAAHRKPNYEKLTFYRIVYATMPIAQSLPFALSAFLFGYSHSMKPIHRNSNLYSYAGFIEFVLRDLELWRPSIDITWKYINSRKFSGSCGWGEWHGRGKSRTYHTRICLDHDMVIYDEEDARKTLAHELRHMWQMYHKHLTSPGGGKVIWRMGGKREIYSDIKLNKHFPNLSFVEYWDRPQEIDAHVYENTITEKWYALHPDMDIPG